MSLESNFEVASNLMKMDVTLLESTFEVASNSVKMDATLEVEPI